MQVNTLLTEDEVAERLRISTRTLSKWRHRGEGPTAIRLTSRCVRYRPESVEAFLDRHEAERGRQTSKQQQSQ